MQIKCIYVHIYSHPPKVLVQTQITTQISSHLSVYHRKQTLNEVSINTAAFNSCNLCHKWHKWQTAGTTTYGLLEITSNIFVLSFI